MPEESNTNSKRPSHNYVMDFLQKNVLLILNLIVGGVLLWSNLNNDVSNINKNLQELSITVKEMRYAVTKLESSQPKIDYIEKQLEEIKQKQLNDKDMMTAIDSVYAQKVAKLEAKIESLEKEINRLERLNSN